MSSRSRFESDAGAETARGSAATAASMARVFRHLLAAGIVAVAGCSPSGPAPDARLSAAEWHEFQGTWTATGSRQAIRLGSDRRASIAKLEGTLLLAGPARPGAGFRAEAIVLNDSATGMVGRAVWTDEHGDEAYSELRGEGTATGSRIEGTFLGGTGRYAGATGTYQFLWRFVLEAEDGAVQGSSVGLSGRVRVGAPPATPRAGVARP